MKFPRHYAQDQTNWYWFENVFTEDELARIDRMSTLFNVRTAVLGEEGSIDEAMRKSAVGWIPMTDEYMWIYQRLQELIITANNALWNFNIYDMEESIQYTEYYEDGGHYDFHLDVGPGYPLNQRKISITVQLSDTDEYEGGDFQILTGGTEPQTLPRKKGCVLVFPSYILHRVTPVTKGTRKSLVLWVGGESYR